MDIGALIILDGPSYFWNLSKEQHFNEFIKMANFTFPTTSTNFTLQYDANSLNFRNSTTSTID